MTTHQNDAEIETAASEHAQEKHNQLLWGIADQMDDLVSPDEETAEITLRDELDRAEINLHELYTQVTNLRRRLRMPPLILSPDTEPPAYQSIVSHASLAELTLEWMDVLSRGHDDYAWLRLNLSRKVDEFDVIDFILVNGQRFNQPANGWSTSSESYLVYGVKKPTSIVIVLSEDWCIAQDLDASGDLQGTGKREIRYLVSLDGKAWGTTMTDRSFRIRRS